MPSVLLAGLDAALRADVAARLRDRGVRVEEVPDAQALLGLRASEAADVVVLDAEIARDAPMDLLTHLHATRPEAEIILLASPPHLAFAAEALRTAASLYLVKPVVPEDVVLAVERALRRRKDSQSLQGLERYVFEQVLGDSPSMRKIASLVAKVAPTDSSVLVTGESGTGKELLARTIHRLSRRSAQPFVAVNCGALPETLLESELFGHAAGAFTGAVKEKRGLFDEAHRGTLFLDEIADTSLAMQVRLLRVLQDGEVRRVGDTKGTHVDVRIVAATNRDLADAVAARSFREDLFYRLNVVHIHLPPLRERRESLPNLIRLFLSRYNRAYGKQVTTVAPDAWAALLSYRYPGNIRELENAIHHALILAEGETIALTQLPEAMAGAASDRGQLPPAAEDEFLTLDQVERRHIRETLDRCGGNQSAAAQKLDISRSTLWRKLKEAGIEGEPPPA